MSKVRPPSPYVPSFILFLFVTCHAHICPQYPESLGHRERPSQYLHNNLLLFLQVQSPPPPTTTFPYFSSLTTISCADGDPHASLNPVELRPPPLLIPTSTHDHPAKSSPVYSENRKSLWPKRTRIISESSDLGKLGVGPENILPTGDNKLRAVTLDEDVGVRRNVTERVSLVELGDHRKGDGYRRESSHPERERNREKLGSSEDIQRRDEKNFASAVKSYSLPSGVPRSDWLEVRRVKKAEEGGSRRNSSVEYDREYGQGAEHAYEHQRREREDGQTLHPDDRLRDRGPRSRHDSAHHNSQYGDIEQSNPYYSKGRDYHTSSYHGNYVRQSEPYPASASRSVIPSHGHDGGYKSGRPLDPRRLLRSSDYVRSPPRKRKDEEDVLGSPTPVLHRGIDIDRHDKDDEVEARAAQARSDYSTRRDLDLSDDIWNGPPADDYKVRAEEIVYCVFFMMKKLDGGYLNSKDVDGSSRLCIHYYYYYYCVADDCGAYGGHR